MNITLRAVHYYFNTYVSVGTLYQNILFYNLMLLILLINIAIVKRKRDSPQVKVNDLLKDDNMTTPSPLSELTDLFNRKLNKEISSLKNELLALGEELELSYIKSDQLNDQLADIAECFEFSILFNDIMWNWSLDLIENNIVFSDYGLRMHSIPKGKLTLQIFLSGMDELDRTNISNAIAETIRTKADFTTPYKVNILTGGPLKQFNLTGRAFFNEEGIPISLSGKFSPNYSLYQQLCTQALI